MKNKTMTMMLLCITFLLGGCSGNETTETYASETEQDASICIDFEYVGESNYVEEYRDKITGVHYLIYNDKCGYAGCGGMTVRYNADGTIYAD